MKKKLLFIPIISLSLVLSSAEAMAFAGIIGGGIVGTIAGKFYDLMSEIINSNKLGNRKEKREKKNND